MYNATNVSSLDIKPTIPAVLCITRVVNGIILRAHQHALNLKTHGNMLSQEICPSLQSLMIKNFFGTKCKCRATGRISFYQLSYTDETHVPNWKPEGNHSPIQDPDPTPSPPLRPPSLAPDNLEDDLVFTGVNCAPVLETNETRDEREKTEGAVRTKHRHSKNTRFMDSTRRTYIVNATNIMAPLNGPLTEFSNLANCVFPLCKPFTEVHSVTTTTKNLEKDRNSSTMNTVL